MKSLRARLIVRTLTACVACFVVAGIALYLSVRTVLIKEFDMALQANVAGIVTATEVGSRGVHVEQDALNAHTAGGRDLCEIWSEDGKLISKSTSLGVHDLARIDFDKPVFVTLPDGRMGRQVSVKFVPGRDEDVEHLASAAQSPVVLSVARDGRELERELRRTAWAIIVVFGLATLAASAAMWPAVSGGLRPVAALADRIKTARQRGLSDRIELDRAPAELMPVVTRLNELLDGIESAFGREKAFTADVAHELRTPISGLEAILEVCAGRDRTGDEYRQVLSRCRATVGQMHRLVEQLLLLARAESGQVVMEMKWVNVSELLKECWDAVEDRARDRSLRLEFEVPETCEIRTDRGLLAVVLHNLLDNAVSYADDGGTVLVKWDEKGKQTALRVSNSGCTLAAADVTKVFEPFWRDDAARTATGRHAGLGLSLCRKIMTLLGGSTTAQVRQGGIFEVELTLDGMCRNPIRATGDKPVATSA
jgi:two-component system sensor histidine kinase QseC